MFGGVTVSETASVTARLNDIAARLVAVASPSPLPESPGCQSAHHQRENVMAVPSPLSAAIAKINDATNQLATVVTSLRSQVGVGMSQADVDAVDAQLGAIATQLTGIAADPNNPVPPVPTTQP